MTATPAAAEPPREDPRRDAQSSAQDDSRSGGPSLISLTGFSYFPLALIARFPFAMMVVGVLTLIVAARGSVELGGVGSAIVGIGSAIFGPLIGAAADRFGQRPTLLITAVVNSIALGVMAWIAYSPLPIWAVYVAAFAIGASVPQASPMSRSRLVTIVANSIPRLRRPRTLAGTLAYESAADEVVFVFGPVVVGVLATVFGAWAPVAGSAVLTLVFITAFSMHRTGTLQGTGRKTPEVAAPASELARPKLLVVVCGMFAVGAVFGTTLTSLTALMQARGVPESAGLLYGVMGVGSAILALSVSLFSPAFTLRYRWLVFAACIVAGMVLLGSSSYVGPEMQMPAVIGGLAVAGIGIGPLLVTQYGFGAARSPAGRSATVMTMLGSSLMLGSALASALTGSVAERLDTSVALLLPLAAATLALLTGLVNLALTPPGRSTSTRTGSIPIV